MTTDKVSGVFFMKVAVAVGEMRKAGLSETVIACIVDDIRTAAIVEERLRAEAVFKDNPPKYPSHVEMRDAIGELIEATTTKDEMDRRDKNPHFVGRVFVGTD